MKRKNRKRLLKIIGAIIAVPTLLVVFAFFAIGPVDISKSNCQVREGIVERISEAASYDVVVKLQDDDAIYYVNRGLERGLELDDLKTQLEGKKVKLWHAKSWHITGGHITQLEADKQIIYTEWDTNSKLNQKEINAY